jgi:hypothetical protein
MQTRAQTAIGSLAGACAVIALLAFSRSCTTTHSPATAAGFNRQEQTQADNTAEPEHRPASKIVIAKSRTDLAEASFRINETRSEPSLQQSPGQQTPAGAVQQVALLTSVTGRLTMRPGSKITVEGTANIIHTRWRLQSLVIGGYFEFGHDFPSRASQKMKPVKVDARAEAFVPIRSLKSIDDEGKPFSDSMDEIVYAHLKAGTNASERITFYLDEFVSAPASNNVPPFHFDATGKLAIAGITNTITIPVTVLPLDQTAFKISGTNSLSMLDFDVEPPRVDLSGSSPSYLAARPRVNVTFDWIVGKRDRSTEAEHQ